MGKGLIIFGLFLILLIVFLKYVFLPGVVAYIQGQASQYVGNSLASNLVTLDNIQRFCTAITSNVGIFGITVKDIANFLSSDTVNKCNQFLIIMQIVSYEFIFYVVGVVFIIAGLVTGRKNEIKKDRKEKDVEEEEDEEVEEEKPKKGKKFCSDCGNPVSPKDKFCENCGSKL